MRKAIIIFDSRTGNTGIVARAIEQGMDVIEPGLRMLRRPDDNGLKLCREFGKRIADKMKNSKLDQQVRRG